MEQHEDNRMRASGYVKIGNGKSEEREMIADAQHQVRTNRQGGMESVVFLRVGAAPRRSVTALDDLVENSIELSLDQARSLAGFILSEVAQGEERIKSIGSG